MHGDMKNHIKQGNIANLASDLTNLTSLDRAALLEKWRTLYGAEPPARIRDNFLLHSIARRMQEQALGGLKPATRRFLEKAAGDIQAGRQVSASAPMIKSGTRLLREWHGVTYEVVVLEKGVQCNGKQYRSLSELARAITGVRWSGPLFFGLRKEVA